MKRVNRAGSVTEMKLALVPIPSLPQMKDYPSLSVCSK